MNVLRADLHIHSVLSPCAELEMSPATIIAEAKLKKLDIIAITDHNSTKQVAVIEQLGKENGIKVIYGSELCTKEEVHVLCYFPDCITAEKFQVFIDKNMPDIQNKEHLFGYQVVVDSDEKIVYTEKRLLLTALNKSIEELEKVVHTMGGLFVPAHVDRQAYGLFSQLGIIPKGLTIDALEFSYNTRVEDLKQKYKGVENYTLITSSDAHVADNVGRAVTLLNMNEPTFNELKNAFNHENGRGIAGYEFS